MMKAVHSQGGLSDPLPFDCLSPASDIARVLNLSMHQNHLDQLKHKLLGLIPRVSDLVSGVGSKMCMSNMLPREADLLICRPHIENHCYMCIKRVKMQQEITRFPVGHYSLPQLES